MKDSKLSDQKSDSTGGIVNRRDFIKISALTTAGGVLASNTAQANQKKQHRLAPSKIDKEAFSVCSFCQARCTLVAQLKDGKVVNVYGRKDNEWTGGSMCLKGKAIVELTYSPHRLQYPLLKKGESWQRISYQEAVGLVAEKLKKVKQDYPEDFAHRVVMFAPLFESREAELSAESMMRLSGFPDVFYSGDTCVGNSGVALHLCLGSGISETTVDEIPNAKVIVLFGANIAELYPPYTRWLQLAREKGSKIIYIDPRITPTSVFADIQIRPRPGTDGALVLGILNYLISNSLYDRKFVASKVTGFNVIVDSAKPYTLERVSEICRVPVDKIAQIARILGNSSNTIAWLSGALSRYTNGIQTARTIIALQAITGNIGGSGKGILHVQSGKPGGDELFSEKYSAHDLSYKLNFRKALHNMKRERVKVLLLNCSFRRYPDSNGVREAVKKVDFVVNRGFFMNEEAKISDLIIPATMAFETSGSVYGLNRQVVWRDKVIEPLGETITESRFYMDLGKLVCGSAFPKANNPPEMYELLRQTSPSWAGMSIERLKSSASGVVWPCPSLDSDGRGTLFKEARFWTDNGKINLHIPTLGRIKWKEPKGSPLDERNKKAKEFPLIFSQGKLVHHWQQTLTTWSTYTAQFSAGNYVQIHPQTAQRMDLKQDDSAWLETIMGRINVTIKITENVLPEVIWTPSYPDPSSKINGNTGETINSIIPNYWDKVAAQYNGFGCRLVKI